MWCKTILFSKIFDSIRICVRNGSLYQELLLSHEFIVTYKLFGTCIGHDLLSEPCFLYMRDDLIWRANWGEEYLAFMMQIVMIWFNWSVWFAVFMTMVCDVDLMLMDNMFNVSILVGVCHLFINLWYNGHRWTWHYECGFILFVFNMLCWNFGLRNMISFCVCLQFFESCISASAHTNVFIYVWFVW